MSDRKTIRSVALLSPLGDFGIEGYTYELAEGLVANGVSVDVYANQLCRLAGFPRRHRLFPVLGTFLYRQREKLGPQARPSSPPNYTSPAAVQHTSKPSGSLLSALRGNRLLSCLRTLALALELVLHLKRRKYDLVWTQWPDIYGNWFWRIAKALRLLVVHTVHNVLPHEESPRARRQCREVYALSDYLFVHSEYSRDELVHLVPSAANKVAVQWHGTYTIFHRRPEARETIRRQLNISDDEIAVLFCGSVRPYKNLDTVLHAIRRLRSDQIVLVVAGEEAGYPDRNPSDVLGRTKRLVRELEISHQARLLPGFLSFDDLGQLFEACDILMLAYEKHYGSGLLALGMTFGTHILATATGGADEYLRSYPNCTLLRSSDVVDIAAGLAQATRQLSKARSSCPSLPEFQWPNIASKSLATLERFLAAQ